MDKKRIIDVLKMISQGMENDTKELDGKPFNGKNVAEQFGYQAAAIAALANILEEVVKDLPSTDK